MWELEMCLTSFNLCKMPVLGVKVYKGVEVNGSSAVVRHQ